MASAYDKYVDYQPRRPDPRDERIIQEACARFFIMVHRSKNLQQELEDLARIIGSMPGFRVRFIHYHKRDIINTLIMRPSGQDFGGTEINRIRKLMIQLQEQQEVRWRLISVAKGLGAAASSSWKQYGLHDLPMIADIVPGEARST